MSSPLSAVILSLSSPEASVRESAAKEIYEQGRAVADRATSSWWRDSEWAALIGPQPAVTVGLAVERATFATIREANGSPLLASVPPEQDAEEFELHVTGGIALDVLTTRDPTGSGAIARYLSKFGEGIQQVEFRCTNVDRAVAILKEKFGLTSVYPNTRPGADGTRINFFLVPVPNAGKVLIELYER